MWYALCYQVSTWSHSHPTFLEIRSEFDDILLKHSAASGVIVLEGVRVTKLHFDTERPTSADWERHSAGEKGTIRFEWLVDASGRSGIVSTQYLRNRHFNDSLRNIACWGYWAGGGVYLPGTKRHNAPWFEALTGTFVHILFESILVS